MPDTKVSALTAVTVPASTDEFPVNQGGTSKKLTLALLAEYLFERISGNSGAAGEYKTLQKLSSNAAANSTATLATVMTTTGVGVGTWHFKYNIRYQSGATTTGVDFAVNHTGTTGAFLMTTWFATTGTTATSGAPDQTSSVTATMIEGKAQRTKNTAVGATQSVDTANADMHMIIEGTIVVTATGSLELKHASETTAASTVMADSILELTKIG